MTEPIQYPKTKTGTFPSVGERRWVNGDFEVEVLGFHYRYGPSGQVQMARVLLGPEHNQVDESDPDINQNEQLPEQLLTLEEALRHNIALGRWRYQEVRRAFDDLNSAEEAHRLTVNQVRNQIRLLTGQDWASAPTNQHTLSALEGVLNGFESDRVS